MQVYCALAAELSHVLSSLACHQIEILLIPLDQSSSWASDMDSLCCAVHLSCRFYFCA